MLTIQKQKAPFYAILQDSSAIEVVEFAKTIIRENRFEFSRGLDGFEHQRLFYRDTLELIKMSPLAKLTSLQAPYASVFSTPPGYYYRAHKDGTAIKWALNYMIEVADAECITSWYDDSVQETYDKNSLYGHSRELENFDKTRHSPVCSVVFEQNDCALINTDIYHDFDNSTSRNNRKILTIRFTQPDSIMWNDILEMLLNASRN